MIATPRAVLPELLDELEPTDPRAIRSRRDLQRVHRAMSSLSILKHAITRIRLARTPKRILELGAGDGSLLLRLAQTLKPQWHGVGLTVLDRHDLMRSETRREYERLEWEVTVLREDALAWAVERHSPHADLCITTLFLHHFATEELRALIAAIAGAADAFVACEPRRNTLARIGSQLVGLLGVNEVTRGDAVKSVAAGFNGQELTSLWPRADHEWVLNEFAALPFTHCFTAVRASDVSAIPREQ
jgi:SAM-dependent methyltransferase